MVSCTLYSRNDDSQKEDKLTEKICQIDGETVKFMEGYWKERQTDTDCQAHEQIYRRARRQPCSLAGVQTDRQAVTAKE